MGCFPQGVDPDFPEDAIARLLAPKQAADYEVSALFVKIAGYRASTTMAIP